MAVLMLPSSAPSQRKGSGVPGANGYVQVSPPIDGLVCLVKPSMSPVDPVLFAASTTHRARMPAEGEMQRSTENPGWLIYPDDAAISERFERVYGLPR